MMDKKVACGTLIGFIVLLIIFFVCMTILGHATTTKPRENSLGVVISDVDPNTAIVGSILEGTINTDKDGRMGISVRIHPKASYTLFDESLMFCGDESDRLSDENGNILNGNYAFTYHRAASRLILGVPCHALVSVDKIVETK